MPAPNSTTASHEDTKPEFSHMETKITTDSTYVHPQLTWKTGVAVLCASLATFAQLLSITGCAGVISFVIQDIGGSSLATWLIAGPTLLQACLSPWIARMSDATGQRKWLVAGTALAGVVGGAVGATAQTINQVIAGQILFGLALTSVGMTSAIPSEVLPHRYRSWAQATVLLSSNISSIIGSIGTGAMVRSAGGWRIIFWLECGVWALVFFGFALVYNPPKSKEPKRTLWQLLHVTDTIGSLLLCASVALLLIGLTWGGNAHPWKSAYVLGPLISGIVCMIAFVLYEWKVRSDGIVDHRLFRLSRNFGICVFALGVEGYVYFSAVAAYVPQIIRALGFQQDPVFIGLRAFIFTAATMVISVPMSLYVTKTKDVKAPLIAGFCFFLAAVIMFSQVAPGTAGDHLFMGSLAVAGIGFTAPLVLLNTVVQLSAPAELIATVTAIVASARALFGSIGSAVCGTILSSKLTAKLPAYVVPVALQAGLPESSIPPTISALFVSQALLPYVPGMTPEIIEKILPAYHRAAGESYSYVWYSLIPWVILAIVAVVSLRSVAPQMNWKVDREYEDTHNRGTVAERDIADIEKTVAV